MIIPHQKGRRMKTKQVNDKNLKINLKDFDHQKETTQGIVTQNPIELSQGNTF